MANYTIYTVWNNLNDEILANGTANQCAKNLNMALNTFWSIMSKTRKGKLTKYSVVVQTVPKNEYLL